VGVKLISYAEQTRLQWMPPAVLIIKPDFSPKPDKRNAMYDQELRDLIAYEDAGLIPMDVAYRNQSRCKTEMGNRRKLRIKANT
jgi:hypothetical protein